MKTVRDPVVEYFISFLLSRYLPIVLVLMAVLLTLPSLWGGLQFDDYLLERSVRESKGFVHTLNTMFVFMDGDTQLAQRNMEEGVYPWFTLPSGRVVFWRPLSALTHWLDFYFFSDLPVLMHAENILWFALGVYLISLLYREFLPAPAAGLAALLFAIDDAHGYAVGWISNRNALMAFAFGLISLLLYHRYVQSGFRKTPLLLVGSAAFFTLSLLSAEAGIAILGYLVAYGFVYSGTSKRNWVALIPHLLTIGIWLYFYRMGGFGGWGTSYIDPARELIPFLQVVVERAFVLLLGFFLYPPAEFYPFVNALWLKSLWVGAGLGLCVFLGILTYPVIRQNKNLQFLLTGAGFSILLNCSSLPANRLLFFAGIGGFAVLAVFLSDPKPSRIKTALWFVHFCMAVLLLPVMSISPKLFGNIEPAILSAPIKPVVIIVSAPSTFHADFFKLIRTRYKTEAPDHVWYLGAGFSSMKIYRPDEISLVIKAAQGYIPGFDAVFRGGAHPIGSGETVDLKGLKVTVQESTFDGRPETVRFVFAESLESQTYQWLVWKNGRLLVWNIPEIGETVEIP